MEIGELKVLELCIGPGGFLTNPSVTSSIFTPFAIYTAERNTVRDFQLPQLEERVVELIADKDLMLFRYFRRHDRSML